MTFRQVWDRVARGVRGIHGLPAALSAGTLPVPRIMRPGALRETWLRLRGARHVWILLPGLAALVILYVFQGFSGNAGIPVAFDQQGWPENESYDAAVAPTGPLTATAGIPVPTPAPSTPYGVTAASALTASGIPEAAQRAYQNAAAALATSDPSCGVHWSVLAGLGRVESNHGRFGGSSIGAGGVVTPAILGIRLDGSRPGTARISDTDGGRYDGDAGVDRAVGPMQFLPGTWKAYGAGGNPQDINAAAAAAARYLCAGSGDLRTPQGRWAAVYRYNHSDSYVSLVLSLADSYATGSSAAFPSRPGGTTTSDGEAATPAGKPAAVPVPAVTRPSPAATTSTTTTAPPATTAPTTTATTAPPATTAPTTIIAPTTTAPVTTSPTVPTVPATTDPVTVSPSVVPAGDPVVT